MNRSLKCLALGAMLSTGMAFNAAAHAQYSLTLCGASPGGLWSLIGAGVDNAVKAAHPGSTITYQTSGGGFANVMQIEQKKCDLALIHDATEHGISTMEDIAGKQLPIRVLLNRRGNVASGVGESMLNAVGAPIEKIEEWGGSVTFAASKEQGEMMRDRRADAILNSLFVNHSSIRQLAEAIELSLVPITEATADAVASEWSIGKYTIPADAYNWADADTLTVTLSAQLFVHEDADPQMVKDVTAALVDHIDQMQGVHKAMAPLSAELMSGAMAVPYHPAAEEVYKAKGLM